ncbi:hypothetical protein BDZ91DRAFT_227520 [Kalaharituber pfeilii]|nr:hypothetical protein BDZ91DRAFT_227520 [Kalaharituber pfeilii]
MESRIAKHVAKHVARYLNGQLDSLVILVGVAIISHFATFPNLAVLIIVLGILELNRTASGNDEDSSFGPRYGSLSGDKLELRGHAPSTSAPHASSAPQAHLALPSSLAHSSSSFPPSHLRTSTPSHPCIAPHLHTAPHLRTAPHPRTTSHFHTPYSRTGHPRLRSKRYLAPTSSKRKDRLSVIDHWTQQLRLSIQVLEKAITTMAESASVSQGTIQTAQPTVTHAPATYFFPLPHQPGAPRFDGNNATDFLTT